MHASCARVRFGRREKDICHNSLRGLAAAPWKILIGIAPVEKCFLGGSSDASNGVKDQFPVPCDDHPIS